MRAWISETVPRGTPSVPARTRATLPPDRATRPRPGRPTRGCRRRHPCLTGGNVLSVEGAAGCFWFTGSQRDDATSQWGTEAEAYNAVYDGALIEVTPAPSGPTWFLNFTTWNLNAPIQTGVVYDELAVSGDDTIGYARTCAVTLGNFRVDELEATGTTMIDTLVSFTAAFSFVCDGSPGALRGCVHYER